jgi:hypothetical protein
MSVLIRPIRRYIPEDGILNSHRHEILKSYIFCFALKDRNLIIVERFEFWKQSLCDMLYSVSPE